MEKYERNWKNYYEILQVSPKAETSIITVAYKRLAQTYHPDVVGDASTARMADINEAYEVLSNPVRRAEYDRVFRTKYASQQAEAEAPTGEELMMALMRYAAEEAAKGRKRGQVADELARKGVPYDVAAQIVQRVFEYRSELKREEQRKEGREGIGCGLLMLIVGGILAAVTGGETIFIVLIGIGAITLIVGFFRWITN